MTSYSLFVVDDEESIREGVEAAFGSRYRIRSFSDAESFLSAIRGEKPDMVLLDIGLPGMSGLDALQAIREIDPDILVIIITAYEDIRMVVTAMKNGAHDYLVKPLHMETLEVNLQNAFETVRLKKEVRSLQENLLRENFPCFIGESNAIQDVMEFVESIARSPDTPVLIFGETGTGKELIAGAIHYRSPNFRGPLISVNCASIPSELIESELFGYERGAFTGASVSGKKGLVELAAGGTLFLDEVGDLSPEAQAKLLRFLETGEFYRVGGTKRLSASTRIVSATNKDLERMIGEGRFREDLFYRLSVVKVKVPSLSDRVEDILPIARYFLVEFGRKFDKSYTGITPEAEDTLKGWSWKGNVRELKNTIERAVLTGKGPLLARDDLGLITQGDRNPAREGMDPFFPSIPPDGIDLASMQESMERHYIHEALLRAGGNESKAARILKMNHHTFRYRRKRFAE